MTGERVEEAGFRRFRIAGNIHQLIEENLNAEKHYKDLMKIYQYAVDKNKRKGKALG